MALMTVTQLNRSIKSIKGNSTKLRNAIQEALISCAFHAAKDGQVTPFNDLLDAVGTSTRIKGLTLWAETYGFVCVKHEKFVPNKSARKDANVTDEASFAEFEKAMREGVAWYDMVAPEPVRSMFDAGHYLDGVLTKLEKENCAALVPFLQTAIDEYNKKVAHEALVAEELARLEALKPEAEQAMTYGS